MPIYKNFTTLYPTMNYFLVFWKFQYILYIESSGNWIRGCDKPSSHGANTHRYLDVMVRCTVMSLTFVVGGLLAIQQGKPKGHGITCNLIYQLPDRLIPYGGLFYTYKGTNMKKLALIISATLSNPALAYVYSEDFTSDFFTIIWNSIQMFFMNLGTLWNRLMILFGSERARENLDAQLYHINHVSRYPADLQTATHIITTTILWVLLIALLIWIISKFIRKQTKA